MGENRNVAEKKKKIIDMVKRVRIMEDKKGKA
jgi:hypothetical protein